MVSKRRNNPDEARVLDIDGLIFDLEIWDDRVLAYGPRPGRVLFFSFKREEYDGGKTSWGMIDQVLARKVSAYIKKNPNQWKRWYGEEGIYTKAGPNIA